MDDDAIADASTHGKGSNMFGILGTRFPPRLAKGVSSVSLAMDDIDEEIMLNS